MLCRWCTNQLISASCLKFMPSCDAGANAHKLLWQRHCGICFSHSAPPDVCSHQATLSGPYNSHIRHLEDPISNRPGRQGHCWEPGNGLAHTDLRDQHLFGMDSAFSNAVPPGMIHLSALDSSAMDLHKLSLLPGDSQEVRAAAAFCRRQPANVIHQGTLCASLNWTAAGATFAHT